MIKTTRVLSGCLLLAVALLSAISDAAKPNILLVLVDDMGSVSYTHLTLPTILLV